MKKWQKIGKFILIKIGYALSLLIIVLALFAGIMSMFTPYLNHHKGKVEATLSHYLQHPVTIEHAEVRWWHVGIELAFQNVSIYEDKNEREIVHANTLTANVAVLQSLWKKTIVFRSLHVDGVDVDIKQLSDNRYIINNVLPLEVGKLQGDRNDSVIDQWIYWLSNQKKIQLSNVHVELTKLHQPLIRVHVEHMLFEPSALHHDIKFSGTYYKTRQLHFDLAAKLYGELSDWKHLSSDIYARLRHVDIKEWLTLVPKSSVVANNGILNAEVWVHYEDQAIKQVQTLFHVKHLVLEKKDNTINKPTFSANTISGQIAWKPLDDQGGWKLVGKDISMIFDSHRWPNAAFEIYHEPKKNFHGVYVSYLNLEDTHQLLSLIDQIPKTLQSYLDQLAPKGVVTELALKTRDPLSEIKHVTFQGAFDALALNPYMSFPGVQGLSGVVEGNTVEGKLTIDSHNAEIDAGNVFSQPLALNQAALTAHWKRSEAGWVVAINDATLANAVAEASGDATFSFSNTKKMPDIDLQANVRVNQIGRLPEVFPMRLFPNDLSAWMSHAFVSGDPGTFQLLWRGNIEDFPYANKEGEFEVKGGFKNLTFHYEENWPDLEALEGTFTLNNQSLHADVSAGLTQGVVIDGASISIPNMYEKPVLTVVGKTREQIVDGFDFIHASPLNESVGKWLEPFELDGDIAVGATIRVPLYGTEAPSVKGELYFKDNTLMLDNKALQFKKLEGKLAFTDSALNAKGITATLAGEPFTFDINMLDDHPETSIVNVMFEGNISEKSLSEFLKTDAIAPYVKGETPLHGYIVVPFDDKATTFQVSLRSDMNGMALTLPAPFAKKVSSKTPVSIDASVAFDQSQATVDIAYDKTANLKVKYNAQKKSGLDISGSMSQLIWPLSKAGDDNDDASDTTMIHSINLSADTIQVYGFDLGKGKIGVLNNKGEHSVTIDTPVAKGSLLIPENISEGINAHFDRVNVLPKPSSKTSSVVSPKGLPPLSIEIDQLLYNQVNYGQVILQTKPVDNGVVIETLDGSSVVYHLAGKGFWVDDNGQVTTSFKGKLTSGNVGEMLATMNMISGAQAKSGDVDFDLSWQGSPFDYDLKKSNGHVSATIKNGVIPMDNESVAMGLGRILSVFSLQSIERRLSFNFSDFTQNGYSFNIMNATADIEKGNANVINSYFDGPEAKIVFNGRVGLDARDYDLLLTISPYVTSTVPIIATIAGGPVAGVAAFAIDKLINNGISHVTTYHYLLRGTWDNPKLIEVKH